MNCLEFKNWLQEWLDAQRPGVEPHAQAPDEAHLRECKSCREEFAAAQRLVEGLSLLPRPKPSADWSRRIAARALEDRAERRQRFRGRLRFTIALAASILIMVIVGYIWEPAPRKDADNGHFANHEAPKNPEPEAPKQEFPKLDPAIDQEPGPALAKTLDEAKGNVAALTERVADRTREHAQHLLAAAPALELPPMGAGVLPDEPVNATASLRIAGEEISLGLEPVTRNARRAMDVLLREISTFELARAD